MSKYPLKVGICKECGKDIFAKNAQMVKPKIGRKFCNKTCQIIWQNKNIKQKPERISKRSGENHWNWNGGNTPPDMKIRKSVEYKLWRTAVFERDNWTCIWCGYKGYVEADHIKQFCDYPELRFAIDNGRTLCKECHLKTDTWGKRSKGKCKGNGMPRTLTNT